MFSGVTATGQHAWAPSSGTLPGSDEDLDAINVGLQGADLEEGSGDSDEHEDINAENYQNSQGVGGQHISSSSNTRSSGKRKQRDVPERRSRKKKSPGIDAFDDEDDEDAVTFIERKYDDDKIILSTAGALTHYYIAYIHKEPCMVSYNTGMRWLNDILRGHWKRCNCIGAIDGTHVRATISPELQIPFFGRKGVPTQNIMAACSFDMQFTFVWAGWEGSAHDTRIFLEAIHSTSIQFPKPPEGKYYLVDAGYPNEYGYLGPYRGERYHLEEFRHRGEPSGRREVFNRAHSSLRNVIERTFGVWKQRWKILQCMPPYPYKTQVQIIVASMALNNYIRRRSQHDDVFGEYDRNPDYIPDELLPDVVACETSQSSGKNSRMDIVRESIANSLMGE
ncbi:protein ALP [Salix suchowensis]|nr:protein ALP [Salix suchowensis]